jgi:hypothetical protein
MEPHDEPAGDEKIAYELTRNHLVHFTNADPRCRGVQLPEGLLLRYMLTQSLYFYLRTTMRDGKIWTRIYASDSPYDRQKTVIGEVWTPMFERRADVAHLEKVTRMLHAWVDFVKENPEDEVTFKDFPVEERRGD